MARYGIPYMGSKNSIAQWILQFLPRAENFYDLFCGGCAITHAAIEQNKYRRYFINDIKPDMPKGFVDCINGKYINDHRWISREDFDLLKGGDDLLVNVCFSFGNNWEKGGYAYGKELEPYKKAIHYAVLFNEYNLLNDLFGVEVPEHISQINDKLERYYLIRKLIRDCSDLGKERKFHSLGNLERIQSLERLNTLISLSDLRKRNSDIIWSSKSYDEVEILDNSVIYCDIPYKDTKTYSENAFDHDKFYDWCLKQTKPVFVSEYNMPSDKFVCIGEKLKQVKMSGQDKTQSSIERIFVPIHQSDLIPKTTLF